jgi:CBS domain containing-hemolysin-like protein
MLSIILLLCFCAFFSGIEITFSTADRLRIELEVQKGSWRGQKLAAALANPNHWLGTTLVAFNIALVALTIQLANWLHLHIYPDFADMYFVESLDLLLIGCVVLIFIEFIPKTIFQIRPTQTLFLLAYPVWCLQLIFSPLVRFSVWTSTGLLQILGLISERKEKAMFGKSALEDFMQNLEEHHSHIDETLFHNALSTDEISVSACMTPRAEIWAVDARASLDELRQAFIESQHTRILVYDKTLDNLVGYIHNHYLLLNPTNVKQYLRPVQQIGADTLVHEVLHKMIRNKLGVIAVCDTQQKLVGMLTLTDVLGVIFGDLNEQDEDSSAQPPV